MFRHVITQTLVLVVLALGAIEAQTKAGDPVIPAKKESVSQKKAREKREQQRLEQLTAKIDSLIGAEESARAFWGIEIVSLDTGKTLYAHNANNLFTPASNAKLTSAISALRLLGPEYRERTTIESDAHIDARGRLAGNLMFVGRGDPNISSRVLPYHLKTERPAPHLRILEAMADEMVKQGLKMVEGNIVGDDSFFSNERYPSGWAQDDLMWEYGAPVSALTINDNEVFLNILPGSAAGDKAYLHFEPETEYFQIENRIVTSAAGTKRDVSIDRAPGSHELVLWGNTPLDDKGMNESLAVDDPALFAAQQLRSMLIKRGVTVTGNAVAHHKSLADIAEGKPAAPATLPVANNATVQPPVPPSSAGAAPVSDAPEKSAQNTSIDPNRTVFFTRESEPLIIDTAVTLKISQNLHAELMLRLVGREKGTDTSLDAALETVRTVLTEAGLTKEEYNFNDGSGLSRGDLVSPHAIVKLLTFANSQPWADSFRASLPVAGVDGSLSERMKGTAAESRVTAKTGTLGHVNALSGYFTSTSGEHFVFSIFCNNHKLTSRGATTIMDKIMEAVVEDKAEEKK